MNMLTLKKMFTENPCLTNAMFQSNRHKQKQKCTSLALTQQVPFILFYFNVQIALQIPTELLHHGFVAPLPGK